MMSKRFIAVTTLVIISYILFSQLGWFPFISAPLRIIIHPFIAITRSVLPGTPRNSIANDTNDRSFIEHINECVQITHDEQELQALRSILHVVKQYHWQDHSRVASLLGQSSDPLDPLLIINAGLSDDIHQGSVVVSPDGFVIGTIQYVDAQQSYMLPVTDEHHRLAVVIASKPDARGVLIGDSRIGMRIDLIPSTVNIKQGDIVVTNGNGDSIPDGIPIGSVASVSTAANAFFQTIQVFSPVNPLNLREVVIPTPIMRRSH